MRLNDGVLTLHQSDISHYLKCPEQFRLANGIGPNATWTPPEGGRMESDAATVGTSLHAVIEADLREPFPTVSSAVEYGRRYMGGLVAEYIDQEVEYRTESFGDDPAKALQELKFLIESWMNSQERVYWSVRDGYKTEQYMEVPFVTRSDDHPIREIHLAGTSDLIDIELNRVVDWKSAGRPYQRWEHQRWAVQPTVYTFMAADQGLIVPNGDGLYRFDYRVFIRGNKQEVQEVTVYRGSGQWGWLTKLVNNIADMMESNAETWPLSDDGWWCGPKWCPFWASCKGAFVEGDWT
jgi:hypothetical protein